ncbi:aldehyde dehydrogenase family protein [Salimicrobium salexigens]|uniref:Glyceraldehyde-3-phosphate dehydrogenase (NADP+) n=1 Tax=Salimicrobium salexigens TaxID=908941 RepID=A0ABY1KQC1_9BACI|nr:aldehyde dehydrogenase family protein [Salimicrobium salexigens]SIS47572.1 glyceraldehyde-3-phosphate dehydrogenase (NADP+) [Salimicrobium salexigens]
MKTTRTEEVKMLLAGEWVQRGETISVINPQNNECIATVPRASKEDMKYAIESAHEKFNSLESWPVHERIRILKYVSRYVSDNAESFARTIASESSKTINEARGEVARSAQTLEIAAEETRRIQGETINFDQVEGNENKVGYYYHFPVGVVGAITPFNDPLNLVAHKLGPAIAGGNAVVLKPASETPLSALKLAEAFTEAGLPEGMLSVVTGPGREIGEELVNHPYVKALSFTGGTDAGKKITEKTGTRHVNMELGSNSPVIVLNDADLKDAVAACTDGGFSAAGQNCISVQRVYVEQDSYPLFLEEFIKETKKLKMGDKFTEDTDVGPLISEKEAKRVEQWIHEAKAGGARVETGGVRNGAYVEPAILTNVPPDSTIAKEEIFGPVVLVEPVQNLKEAVDKSNDVEYGLQAGIFTRDVNRAFYAVQNLQVGGVMVNDSSDFRIDAMPFGGTKDSGIGREGVKFAIDTLTEKKVVSFKLSSPF